MEQKHKRDQAGHSRQTTGSCNRVIRLAKGKQNGTEQKCRDFSQNRWYENAADDHLLLSKGCVNLVLSANVKT